VFWTECYLFPISIDRNSGDNATVETVGSTVKLVTLGALAVSAISALAQPLPEKVTFNKHIRPILSDNCFACHGFDKNTREAGLRLDTAEGASTPVDGRIPIAKGNADKSEVIKRILSTDAGELMPPPETHKKLTKHQKELLRRWIDQGAEYEAHWSFIPPKTPAIPSEWKGREIDYLVNQELSKKGFKPSPKAERWRLVRRLYLDLIGLPPSAKEMEAALEMDHDTLVNKLLASPHYGEKMAVSWLDLVRYADSVGYHGDQPVSVSPYRDYVINAFNQNMPFDRFTREQIAGDLIPNSTRDQKVASGYNRLNMTSEEGGAQAKEYLAKYSGDRVRTTSVVWMGATLGCAECHDHKFDPYTMRDFYSMAAFFSDIQEKGVYSARKRDPIMKVYSDAEVSEKVRLKKEISLTEAKIAKDPPGLAAAQKEWEASLKLTLNQNAFSNRILGEDEMKSIASAVVGTWEDVNVGQGPVYSGKTSRKQSVEGLGQHYVKFKDSHVFKAGDRVYTYVWIDETQPPATIMLQVLSEKSGGWNHRAFWGADEIHYGGIGKKNAAHRPKGNLPSSGQWAYLEVPIEELGLKAGDRCDGIAFTQFNGTAFWDQFGISSFSTTLPEEITGSVITALKVEEGQRSESQVQALRKAYRGLTPLLKKKPSTAC